MAKDHKSWADKLTIGRLVALEGLYLKRMSEPVARPAAAQSGGLSAGHNAAVTRRNAAHDGMDNVAVFAGESATIPRGPDGKRDFLALVR